MKPPSSAHSISGAVLIVAAAAAALVGLLVGMHVSSRQSAAPVCPKQESCATCPECFRVLDQPACPQCPEPVQPTCPECPSCPQQGETKAVTKAATKAVRPPVPAGLPEALRQAPAGQGCLEVRDHNWTATAKDKHAKVFSQQGEDGMLLWILDNIGVTTRYYVEFGCEDGSERNTRVLSDLYGWTGLLMDGGNENSSINLHKEFISPGNINALLAKYNVPKDLDLLSIDVGFDDYFVWLNISDEYKPRIVSVEHQYAIRPPERRVVNPNDTQRWTFTQYSGASIQALADLGHRKGYSLVCSSGVNLFFVRNDILECQHMQVLPVEQLYYRLPLIDKPGFMRAETNTSRLWLFLDETGAVVKREFRPGNDP